MEFRPKMAEWEPSDLIRNGFRTGLRPSMAAGERRGRRNAVLWFGVAVALVASPAAVDAETMSGALTLAYQNNPDLNQQRAGVRAADENIPQAAAAFRPQVTPTGQYGYSYSGCGRRLPSFRPWRPARRFSARRAAVLR